jgi:hypothetical protein
MSGSCASGVRDPVAAARLAEISAVREQPLDPIGPPDRAAVPRDRHMLRRQVVGDRGVRLPAGRHREGLGHDRGVRLVADESPVGRWTSRLRQPGISGRDMARDVDAAADRARAYGQPLLADPLAFPVGGDEHEVA